MPSGIRVVNLFLVKERSSMLHDKKQPETLQNDFDKSVNILDIVDECAASIYYNVYDLYFKYASANANCTLYLASMMYVFDAIVNGCVRDKRIGEYHLYPASAMAIGWSSVMVSYVYSGISCVFDSRYLLTIDDYKAIEMCVKLANIPDKQPLADICNGFARKQVDKFTWVIVKENPLIPPNSDKCLGYYILRSVVANMVRYLDCLYKESVESRKILLQVLHDRIHTEKSEKN